MAVIDLSRLPPPQIVDVPDFETLLAERKAAFVALYPVDEQDAVRRTLALESEPVTKLLQESTYREILLRQRINEAAQAVMVAYSMGNDLEQLAANCNVKRLTVVPADNDAVPPVAAVMEDDEALRQRILLRLRGCRLLARREPMNFTPEVRTDVWQMPAQPVRLLQRWYLPC
ncbi:phage baseplate assembly protein J [Salmonella enterica subsp. enterica]|uniref:Phage baseplate assembly protein J n=1 Tax=Salmonella enterica I TaxID=59201 RepID=A0A447P463_SALET|nr:phage baseplate assembly protein J [Salmonella enterica subsp. enterica]